jgi:DNA-binding MarR family transcriptional regulator
MRGSRNRSASVAIVDAANRVAPPSDSTSETVGSRVSYLVYRLERRLRYRLDQAVADQDVSVTEYVTLSVLRNNDRMSNAQLARWAFVTPQAMNLVVSSLESRRLIRRKPSATNRRVLEASVTQLGRNLLARCEALMDAIEADMLADLSASETELLRRALRACAHSLETSTANRPGRPAVPATSGGTGSG